MQRFVLKMFYKITDAQTVFWKDIAADAPGTGKWIHFEQTGQTKTLGDTTHAWSSESAAPSGSSSL